MPAEDDVEARALGGRACHSAGIRPGMPILGHVSDPETAFGLGSGTRPGGFSGRDTGAKRDRVPTPSADRGLEVRRCGMRGRLDEPVIVRRLAGYGRWGDLE